MGLRDEQEKQRTEAMLAQGLCPYSSLPGPECKSWLCDCFDFEERWGVSQK